MKISFSVMNLMYTDPTEELRGPKLEAWPPTILPKVHALLASTLSSITFPILPHPSDSHLVNILNKPTCRPRLTTFIVNTHHPADYQTTRINLESTILPIMRHYVRGTLMNNWTGSRNHFAKDYKSFQYTCRARYPNKISIIWPNQSPSSDGRTLISAMRE